MQTNSNPLCQPGK